MTSTFDYNSWQAKLIALELANRVGKEIMKLISEKPYTATQISEKLEIPISTVLYHLARLETTGLVKTFRGYGKRLRGVKYYKSPSSKIVFEVKRGEKNDRET